MKLVNQTVLGNDRQFFKECKDSTYTEIEMFSQLTTSEKRNLIWDLCLPLPFKLMVGITISWSGSCKSKLCLSSVVAVARLCQCWTRPVTSWYLILLVSFTETPRSQPRWWRRSTCWSWPTSSTLARWELRSSSYLPLCTAVHDIGYFIWRY